MKKSVLGFVLGMAVASCLPALCQSVLTYERGFLEKASVVGAGTLLNGVAQSAGQLTLTGADVQAVSSKSASFTAAASNAYVTGTTSTATLPDATACQGQKVIVKVTGSSATVTMSSTSSQTIDGGAAGSTTIAHGNKLTFISDGANWFSF